MENKLDRLQLLTLQLMLEGYDVSEIPDKLYRSLSSVESYARSLRKHFKVDTLIGVIVESARYNYLYEYLREFRENGVSISKEELLSDIEKVVLHELLKGKRQKQIANELKYSNKQVEYYKQRICDKWQVQSNADLVIKSFKKNYLRLTLNSPIINLNDKDKVFEMFQKGKQARGHNVEKYSLQLWSPRKLLFRLSEEERTVLTNLLEGISLQEQTRLLKKPIRKLNSTRTQFIDKLDVNNRIELILIAIDLGVIVIDNWQDHRIETLSPEKKSFFIETGALSISKSLDEMKVPGFEDEHAKEIYSEIASLWGKNTIEGIIVDGLRRGDYTLDQLEKRLWSNFI